MLQGTFPDETPRVFRLQVPRHAQGGKKTTIFKSDYFLRTLGCKMKTQFGYGLSGSVSTATLSSEGSDSIYVNSKLPMSITNQLCTSRTVSDDSTLETTGNWRRDTHHVVGKTVRRNCYCSVFSGANFFDSRSCLSPEYPEYQSVFFK